MLLRGEGDAEDEVLLHGEGDAEDDAEVPSRLVAPRTMVFTTLYLLSLLCVASHVHVDGTFKVQKYF